MTTTTYTTRDEAILREIIEPLGDYASQHDTDAIAEEVLSYYDGRDDEGTIHLDCAGFYLSATTDAFWAAVERHAL